MKTISELTKKTTLKALLILTTFGFLTISCNDDDENPVIVNEGEVITTMNITLSTGGAEDITIQTRDIDADGPGATIITINKFLSANTTYTGSIELLNETVLPIEDVTEEIEEEDEEHQFFFSVDGAIDSAIATDQDDNGEPIGLTFSLVTGNAGNATLQVTLRHEPKKPNDGTLEDAGGDTDISQTFSLVVE